MKVTRKYKNKAGQLVVKTYNYEKKNPVQKLTTKKGEMSKRAQALLDKELKKSPQSKIDWYQETIAKYQMEKKVLTLTQLNTMYKSEKLAIFLANMGFNAEDIAEEIKLQGVDVNENWILDQAHWTFHSEDDADIMLPNGDLAYFVYNYNEHTYLIEVRSHQITSEDVEDWT